MYARSQGASCFQCRARLVVSAKNLSIVLVTTGNIKDARSIVNALVSKKLAPYRNICPIVNSIYRCKNRMCDEQEYLLLIKTQKTLLRKVEIKIRELHKYEVPEILAMPLVQGS